MKNKPPLPPPDDRHQRVLAAIRNGSRTWEEIAAAAHLKNSKLGLVFNDLLTRKQVKSIVREGVRIYLLR